MSVYNTLSLYKVTRVTPYHEISKKEHKIFDIAYNSAFKSDFDSFKVGACISSIKGTNVWV